MQDILDFTSTSQSSMWHIPDFISTSQSSMWDILDQLKFLIILKWTHLYCIHERKLLLVHHTHVQLCAAGNSESLSMYTDRVHIWRHPWKILQSTTTQKKKIITLSYNFITDEAEIKHNKKKMRLIFLIINQQSVLEAIRSWKVYVNFSVSIDMKTGVRQACVLSPCLFTEKTFKEISKILRLIITGRTTKTFR